MAVVTAMTAAILGIDWPTITAPSAAWWSLAAIPLVLLYLLKLRRPPRRVPSLLLWRAVLADQRVNAPLRRLQRNLLLLLQLALLSLLTLALMQPVIGGDAARERVILLIDQSASMAAVAPGEAETRLAMARARAVERIDALATDGSMALIGFAKTAKLAHSFSNDRRALRAAVDEINVEDRADELGEALRMAAALAQTVAVDRVVLISDGVLPDTTDFALPFTLEFDRVGDRVENAGITHLGASRDPRGGWQILVVVEGTPGARADRLVVTADGAPIVDEPVALQAQTAERFVVALPAGEDDDRVRTIEVELHTGAADALRADDHGLLELRPQRPLRVAVDGDQWAFRHALAAQPMTELLEADAPDAPDLVVTADERRLRDDAVGFLLGVPDVLAEVVEVLDGGSAVVDWDRAAPLLRHALLDDLLVLEQPAWRPSHSERELEQAGYEVLVHGTRGPLLVRRGRDPSAAQVFAMLFDPEQSTLPYRVAFPVMLANLSGLALQAAGLRDVEALRAGPLPAVDVGTTANAVALEAPDGSRQQRAVTGGIALGLSAPRCGWHTVRVGDAVQRRFGVNLLERRETLLEAREQLMLDELTVRGAAADLDPARSLWSWLALLGLPLLLADWWFYRRRPRYGTAVEQGRTPAR